MADEENRSLILQPSYAVADGGTASRRIVEEMVSGTVANLNSSLFLASGEDAEARYQRGEDCFYGLRLPQRCAEAVRCYRAAADLNNVDAICNLACMLSAGLGVNANPEAAFELFSQVRDRLESLGDKGSYAWVISMLNMATCYHNAWGTERNEKWSLSLTTRVYHHAKSATALEVTTPGRSEGFFTVFDIVLPYGGEWQTVYFLRKVQVVGYNEAYLQNRVLVIEGGDGGLNCGDLVGLDWFQKHSQWTCNEGGKSAEGLLFTADPHQGAYDDCVVGRISCRTAHIVSSKCSIAPSELHSRLVRMGIGPLVVN